MSLSAEIVIVFSAVSRTTSSCTLVQNLDLLAAIGMSATLSAARLNELMMLFLPSSFVTGGLSARWKRADHVGPVDIAVPNATAPLRRLGRKRMPRFARHQTADAGR